VSAEVWISTGLAAERGKNMPVRRITGIGQRHAVARLEQREEGEDESARRSGGDDDPARIEREAILLLVMARDAPAQRGNAGRLGIAEIGARQRRARRFERGRRRRRGGLTGLHMDDAAAGGLDLRRCRHHVHDDEGRHVAAQRGRNQLFGILKHSVLAAWLWRRRNRAAPLLPHSLASLRGGAKLPRRRI
jgi:hypothetical protein